MGKGLLRQSLPILLAIGLLWYVLKDIPLADIGNQFRRADYRWLFLVGIEIGLYNVVRAARWQLTLQALGYQASLFRTTVALLAGTMASLIIPGAGELTRCGTLQRTDGIPLAQGIGSVVAERVIDLIMLAVLTGLTLLLEFNRVSQYISSSVSSDAPQTDRSYLLLTGLGLIVVVVIALYWILRNESIQQHRYIAKLRAIGSDLAKGFTSILKLRHPVWFTGLTVISYLLIYLATYTLFFTSPFTTNLPPTAPLSVITAGSVGGLAVPTQAGLGTYHYLVSRVLLLYGLPKDESVAMATFMHAVQTGFALLFSSLSFLIVPVLIRQKNSRINEPTV